MFKRILLPLDGSTISEQALPIAVSHAKSFNSTLVLFRVISPLSKSFRTGMATVTAIERAEEQLRRLAQDYLESIATNLREDNLEVSVDTLIGVPYKEIITYSEKNSIDLIIMCTRGESGFTRWLLGSNTDNVIRGTRVPVLAVPAIE